MNENNDVMAQIDKAAKEFNEPELMRLTRLPLDVIKGERIMDRAERRKWYHDNKKRLNLPPWNKLDTLMKK